MPTFTFRVRFNWSQAGINAVNNAGHRRRIAVTRAEAANIRVIRADFVLDGKAHIEWLVETDANNMGAAAQNVRDHWTNVFIPHGNIIGFGSAGQPTIENIP